MRSSDRSRSTKETQISVRLDLDGVGNCAARTGIGFFDHMLDAFARHSGFDLVVECKGDLHIDAHHTVEDAGIVLGAAVLEALGDRKGIVRFADATVPLDEALVRAVVDISGRPFIHFAVETPSGQPRIGDFDAQLTAEFWRAFAMEARITLHLDLIRGVNAHHIAEATFKAAARALGAATRIDASRPVYRSIHEGRAVTARPSVVVLDYGAGNLRSVVKAFEHEGADAVLTSDPEVARNAERLVLPGQGHFGQCIGRLEESGLADAVREVVADGRPFLGICVGMQLLYEGSEEAPAARGLGFLPGTIRRIPTSLHLPHVGWNSVAFSCRGVKDPLLAGVAGTESRFFYHVHTYARLEADADEVLGACSYGVDFATIVRRRNVWGIQFHPEKSQEDGLAILRNFARLSPAEIAQDR